MMWYFIGVYKINRTLHGRLEIRNFSSRVKNIKRNLSASVEKYCTSERSELVKYFSTLAEKFRISVRPCIFLYITKSNMIFLCLLWSPTAVFTMSQQWCMILFTRGACSHFTWFVSRQVNKLFNFVDGAFIKFLFCSNSFPICIITRLCWE